MEGLGGRYTYPERCILEDVVLNGSAQLVRRNTLLLTKSDVHGQQNRGGALIVMDVVT
jgi:hypothetical protein